jgi:glc operon protein GlcG
MRMNTFTRLFTVISLGALVGGAQAQTQFAEKKVLTLDGAKKVMASAMALAKRYSTTGVIAIVDDGGNLITLERIDNTFAAGANISIGKARTAALFKKPTRFFEEIIKKGRTAMVALNDFTPLQGGVPITIDGQIVGAIGVSGAASADQDEELAEAGANAFASTENVGQAESLTLPVTYFDKDVVAAAFARGAVLFDGSGNRNYMIHTSRREKPGMAEVHTQDTDLIYVTEGTCTFVTGGTVVDGKKIAANEIRGASIRNGETRKLTKGDVIIVPAGVPHWFQEVKAPFTYYVVKVR